MSDIKVTIELVLAIGGLLALIGGWFAWIRPRFARSKAEAAAVRDAILGRDVVRDSITGKELAPALPGIGQRMAFQESQMSLITEAVSKLADSHSQLAAVHTTLEDHADRITKLELGAVERIYARRESAAAWDAIASVALQPDEDGEVDEV